MSVRSRHGSKIGFALRYLAYVISYVDRAAISLGLAADRQGLQPWGIRPRHRHQRLLPRLRGMVNFGGQSAGFVAPAAMGFLVTGTRSFDAAFDFLLVMTALAVLVATTIRSREPQLVQSLA